MGLLERGRFSSSLHGACLSRLNFGRQKADVGVVGSAVFKCFAGIDFKPVQLENKLFGCGRTSLKATKKECVK